LNTQKLTQKSLEALNSAQNIALENQNLQVTPEHLLYALLDQDGGLIGSLLEKAGVDTNAFLGALSKKLDNIPRVTGSGREPDKIYISPECDRVLTAAERTAGAMGDDYVSVEHIFLSLMEKPPRRFRCSSRISVCAKRSS